MTVAAVDLEVCDLCHAERPAQEFVVGLSKDYDASEHHCGVCRAKNIIALSRYFGLGPANDIVGTLNAATNLKRDERGERVRNERGEILDTNWLSAWYGLSGGWLHVLEMDSYDLAREQRRAFAIAHLHECRVDAGPDVLGWRVKK